MDDNSVRHKPSMWKRRLVYDDGAAARIRKRQEWIWMWIVSRQGPKLGHRTDETRQVVKKALDSCGQLTLDCRDRFLKKEVWEPNSWGSRISKWGVRWRRGDDGVSSPH